VFQIIDNFLNNSTFNTLSDSIIKNTDFPWYISRAVSDKSVTSEGGYLLHMFYSNYRVNSNNFPQLIPLLEKVNPSALMRIKANFYHTTNEVVHHENHIDFPKSHKGFVFYLNTNNGKTILNDETVVDSVANRILLFDPSVPHRSTTCSDDPIGRFNINCNYF